MDLMNAIVALTNFVLIPGIAYGSQLAIGALGVTMVYGILRFSNFAHGDTMAFGTMITILATWGLQAAGITAGPLPTALLALPIGIAATAILVLTTDRLGYRFNREVRACLAHQDQLPDRAGGDHARQVTEIGSLRSPTGNE